AANQQHRVVVESLVGGKAFRAEPGELCVARRTDDGKSYDLLQAQQANRAPTPLTDVAVEAARSRIESSLAEQDDRARHTAAASREAFWQHRHEAARTWASKHPVAAVPSVSDQGHAIDAFLAAK